ncbi:MAG: DUF1801 domain-containing protein [Sediminibacterium sp.]|nr:DUF1801 domain-containing protein [Sediminibacterium sp.]
MHTDIQAYHNRQLPEEKAVCDVLYRVICQELPEALHKIWHAHPVWFLEDNPIVGYSKQKQGIRLMFWSGADFEEDALHIRGGKFKDASIFYQSVTEISPADLKRWLEKSENLQWDYKNIVKRKGQLLRLK